MYFYYLQLQHVVSAKNLLDEFCVSPTLIFCMPQQMANPKRFCLTHKLLRELPLQSAGELIPGCGRCVTGDLWEMALIAVSSSSLNVSRRLSQLYILL